MDSSARSAEQRGEVDMSAAAIRQRLDEVQQLYELGMYLAQAHEPAVGGKKGETQLDATSTNGRDSLTP